MTGLFSVAIHTDNDRLVGMRDESRLCHIGMRARIRLLSVEWADTKQLQSSKIGAACISRE